MLRLAREEFGPTLTRVSRKVGAAIEELARPDGSDLWREAVRATLALHQAPQHYLRSQLLLIGHLAGGGAGEGEGLERFAAGLELLHLFMLVHDDVIDEARLRRGRPTLHLALQQAAPGLGASDARNLAVLVGDVLNVLAMRHLVGGDAHGAALKLVLDACLRTGFGQFEDTVGWRGGLPADVEAHAVEDKAAYQSFAAPFAGGLLLADPTADPAPAIAWGRRMGAALQGADDLGDLVGDPAETGKDNLRDLLEGRLSLVLLVLMRRASAEERAFVLGVMGHGALAPGDRVEVERLVAAHGVLEACGAIVRGHLDEAARLAAASPYGEAAKQGMAALARGLGEALDALLARSDGNPAVSSG